MSETDQITALLDEMRRGNQDALPRLIPLLYNDLRRLAAHCLRDERGGHTLQATALVHEAYLRLVDQTHASWETRGQFMGVATQIMRRILVDYARQRVAAKRGGGAAVAGLDAFEAAGGAGAPEEMLAVDEAIERLAALDPQQARVVEMRYFGGLTVEETAEALGVAPRTVKRDWAMAKAWLQAQFAPKAPR